MTKAARLDAKEESFALQVVLPGGMQHLSCALCTASTMPAACREVPEGGPGVCEQPCVAQEPNPAKPPVRLVLPGEILGGTGLLMT